jgi:hypothetical protein
MLQLPRAQIVVFGHKAMKQWMKTKLPIPFVTAASTVPISDGE